MPSAISTRATVRCGLRRKSGSDDFKPKTGLTGPHQEDAEYSNLKFAGPCTASEFKAALTAGLFKSVEDGFEIKLGNAQKHIPIGHPVRRSIITLAVDPKSIAIVEDGYKLGKIRIHFTGRSGRQFRYLSITDLGFYRYAETHRTANDLASLNAFIWKQPEAYLRIGLSRAHEIRGTQGYWMQANGIYTFPDFVKEIRSYKKRGRRRAVPALCQIRLDQPAAQSSASPQAGQFIRRPSMATRRPS